MKRAMKHTSGYIKLTIATVLQPAKLPPSICVKTPKMTDMVDVADKIPRKRGWVTSATYVITGASINPPVSPVIARAMNSMVVL